MFLFVIFVANFINKFYFPVFIPIGVVGNILSFLVSKSSHGYDKGGGADLEAKFCGNPSFPWPFSCRRFLCIIYYEYGSYIFKLRKSVCSIQVKYFDLTVSK